MREFMLYTLAAAALAQETTPKGEGVLFEDMAVVEAASLHRQALAEAPASVTVITAEDIRKFGYRTLGDALNAARGFYLTTDRTYRYAGLRGFLLPGDFNSRFLVLLNGRYMTDNIYNAAANFGQDFGLDMDLVKRIEIIRGPSSSLYGSNGLMATVNIVTQSPVDHERARFSTELGSFGQRKAQISSSLDLGGGANLLVSASLFNNRGQPLDFPDRGRAVGVDGERGYHTFASLEWKRWSFTGLLSSREKHVPVVPWTETLFADRGNKIQDARGFAEAAYSRAVGTDGRLRWRLYYDRYQFHGRYDGALEEPLGIEDTRDYALGDWVGSQLTYRREMPRRWGALTVGAETSWDLRALQRTEVISPRVRELLNAEVLERSYGLFAQEEVDLAKHWKAVLGVRFDDANNRRSFVSPRAALLYQRQRTALKFLYGRAFRNPTVYELLYNLSVVGNPSLRPEKVDTVEAAVERKVASRLNGIATVYHTRLGGLIRTIPVDNLYQFQNAARYRGTGVELELNGNPALWLQAVASLAIQRSDDGHGGGQLPNSPGRIGKLRFAVPIANKLDASAGFQYVSARYAQSGYRLAPVWLGELTITTRRLAPNFDLACGIRNLFDRRYEDPAGGSVTLDRLIQDGRSAYVKLIWRVRE
ncbi:MAG: TonB-dependent receptor [Acidobacteria bacterium]|nr:TonB-dependent receptor [Acidobacteriota bacterium]